MKNIDIILGCCALNGITEPVDTYPGWKRRGKQVKRGSKALFSTKIWKPSKSKVKILDEYGDEETGTNMILVNAAFFGLSQVEDIQ